MIRRTSETVMFDIYEFSEVYGLRCKLKIASG